MNASGVYSLSVVSSGARGLDLIYRLQHGLGARIAPYARKIIEGAEFRPTVGTVTHASVLPASVLGSKMLTSTVRQEGSRRGLRHVGIEASCLTAQDIVVRGDMRFRQFVFMREPEEDDPFRGNSEPDDVRRLLVLSYVGSLWNLCGYHDVPDFQWYSEGVGFVFGLS